MGPDAVIDLLIFLTGLAVGFGWSIRRAGIRPVFRFLDTDPHVHDDSGCGDFR